MSTISGMKLANMAYNTKSKNLKMRMRRISGITAFPCVMRPPFTMFLLITPSILASVADYISYLRNETGKHGLHQEMTRNKLILVSCTCLSVKSSVSAVLRFAALRSPKNMPHYSVRIKSNQKE